VDLDTLVAAAEMHLRWGEEHGERVPLPPKGGRLDDWDSWRRQVTDLMSELRPPDAG
jgi:hypothetical protein